MSENIQELVDLVTRLWNTGNLELVGQVYSDKAQRFDPDQPELARGVHQIGDYVAEIRTAFPDFKIEINQTMSQGDQIVMLWTCTGTQNGVFGKIPPTGRRAVISGVTLSQLSSSQIVEERVYFDRLALLQQLGVAPE